MSKKVSGNVCIFGFQTVAVTTFINKYIHT